MAIVHDLAEAIVGDITPHDGISKEEKYAMELKAITEITNGIGGSENENAKMILDLWFEYESNQVYLNICLYSLYWRIVQSLEAKLVKDMDRFEMLLSAFEYERDQGLQLQEFFNSTEDSFQTGAVKALVQELKTRRGPKWPN